MVNYWFNISYLPRQLGVSTILENLVLSTIVTTMMSTAFAPSWRGIWMRITKARVGTMWWVVDTQSVATDVRWPFEWRFNARAIGYEGRSQNAFDSTDKHP